MATYKILDCLRGNGRISEVNGAERIGEQSRHGEANSRHVNFPHSPAAPCCSRRDSNPQNLPVGGFKDRCVYQFRRESNKTYVKWVNSGAFNADASLLNP